MIKYVDMIAVILLIVGGLNWGLFAFFDFNIVSFIFSNAMLAKGVYGLVAASALWKAYRWCGHKCGLG